MDPTWILRNPWAISTLVQPIVRLDDRAIIGYEALARVATNPSRPPDWWLDQAEEHGARTDLEAAFLHSAARLGPPARGASLFVNVSPAALADPTLLALRDKLPDRLVVEITEQAAVDDYAALKDRLEEWAATRVRVAIDDTGAGYSSLRHVVELSPDFLKLDRTLVRDIDKDLNRHALVRALVAFAREVGTSVIAEGVESAAELAALGVAEVPLVQGFLIGKPAPAWPEVEAASGKDRRRARDRDASLRAALAGARDADAACEAVVSHLFRQGQAMPSLYLERNGRLRCVAQRGLWQVLDGLHTDAGITGRVWSGGRPIVVDDVSSSAEYLEAVPGVMAEICVPVVIDGETVGALNVDWLSPLPHGALRALQDCAALLARRLNPIGWRPADSPWQRALRGSLLISGVPADEDAAARVLEAVLAASGMDSAGLARGDIVEPAVGPLASALRHLDSSEVASLCGPVDRLSSCYTGRESTGLAYEGSEVLRASGARALVLLPLRANQTRLGTIILAHSRPMRLGAEVVEPLELLAGQAAAALEAVDLVGRLRHAADHDGLTGLRNRAMFERMLGRLGGSAGVLIADVDHFKRINDCFGHLAGDQALCALAAELAVWLPGVPFYRFGGDELTCLLPDADAEAVRRTAELVCAVGRRVLGQWNASISVGAAITDGPADARGALARADAALLWTKQHARSQATIAPADAEPAELRQTVA